MKLTAWQVEKLTWWTKPRCTKCGGKYAYPVRVPRGVIAIGYTRYPDCPVCKGTGRISLWRWLKGNYRSFIKSTVNKLRWLIALVKGELR